ncbi:MAG: GTP cyclohydrolase II [Chaenotheca gracillima]|nr:MAG: GTP cyclohydrolase II [Chaenotheca gracillima]
MALSKLLKLAVTALLALKTQASDNGLAITPQMGWDNWNAFGCDVSEDLLLGTAQKIVDYGLRDLGYHYVILDDCWSVGRSDNGTLMPNSTRFPNGMGHVADRLHSMNLGFGMYSSAGTLTCARYPASLGYEEQDAKTFASWGVDYLKYDNCYNEGQSGTPQITYNRYKKMGDALNATGRPILYSLCNWGEDYPWKWAQTISNSWRMSGDVFDYFDRADPRCPCSGDEGYNCALPGFHCSVMNILNKLSSFADKGIPGAWNDLDMLEVGNGGMTDDEYKSHFSMWAAVKSPLIMGNDIRVMTPQALSILSNPAVLAISQDPAGSSAFQRWRYLVNSTDSDGQGEIQMWSGALDNGDYVVVLLNAANSDMMMNATLADIFIDNGPGGTAPEIKQSWDVYDLWANRMSDEVAGSIINGTGMANATNTTDSTMSMQYNATETSYADGLASNNTALYGNMTTTVKAMGTLTANVPKHGVAMYRLRPQAPATQKRDEL